MPPSKFCLAAFFALILAASSTFAQDAVEFAPPPAPSVEAAPADVPEIQTKPAPEPSGPSIPDAGTTLETPPASDAAPAPEMPASPARPVTVPQEPAAPAAEPPVSAPAAPESTPVPDAPAQAPAFDAEPATELPAVPEPPDTAAEAGQPTQPETPEVVLTTPNRWGIWDFGSGMTDANFFPLMRFNHNEIKSTAGNFHLIGFSVLDIPFFTFTNCSDGIVQYLRWIESGEATGNPLAIVHNTDQPLLSAFSVKAILRDKDGKLSAMGSRARIIDSLIFGLYQEDKWLEDQYVKTWGVIFPDIKVVALERTNRTRGTFIVDSQLFSLYRNYSEPRGSDFRIADTILAGVFTDVVWGDRRQWNALSIPYFSGADYRRDDLSRDFTLLGTRSENTGLPPRRAPWVALWFSTNEADGDSAKEFLRLPLLGPVFSRWKQDEEKHWHVFPRIMTLWKYPH